MNRPKKIAVACPGRSVCDHHARVFASMDRLQGHYLGTRNGVLGIPDALFHRFPLVGLISYAAAKIIPRFSEAAKVACFPLFDQWVKSKIPAGTPVFSSYGYAVEAFRKSRESGGFTILDGGNSHFANYWKIVSEEHKKWGVDEPPFPKQWYERGLQTIELTDWVFSPSKYVTDSFIEQGFPSERILYLPYPVNLDQFSPSPEEKIPDSPLRVICTGNVSYRKGFPYLLDAMRILGKSQKVELLLTEGIQPAMQKILDQYPDVKINWSPPLDHSRLGARLKSAHVFALLSIEEGLARTALEAMACGLPVVLTPNTGVSDFVKPGINGEIVPIRDSQAAAEAILKCYHRKIQGANFVDEALKKSLSFEKFTERLLEHMHWIDSQTTT